GKEREMARRLPSCRRSVVARHRLELAVLGLCLDGDRQAVVEAARVGHQLGAFQPLAALGKPEHRLLAVQPLRAAAAAHQSRAGSGHGRLRQKEKHPGPAFGLLKAAALFPLLSDIPLPYAWPGCRGGTSVGKGARPRSRRSAHPAVGIFLRGGPVPRRRLKARNGEDSWPPDAEKPALGRLSASILRLVGETGFEPATSTSRT